MSAISISPAKAAPTTTPVRRRDTRLDVLRALALLMIFIDHVPGQPLEHWTMKNFGFSDASELFVLISGIAVALAYGRKYDLTNLASLSVKAWRRVVTLFVAHMTGTLLTLGIFVGAAWLFLRPDLMQQVAIGPVMEAPAKGLVALTTLGHQLGYNNILPMYMALMAMAPAMIWLERRNPSLLIAASALLWAIAGTWRIGPPRMLEDGIWFFNPLSWQFLFVIGYVGARHIARGGRIGGSPGLLAASITFVLFSALWTVINLGAHSSLSLGLPFVLTGFDKTYLTGWRLVHMMALVYIFLSVPFLSRITRLDHDNPLAVIGRHGLAIFLIGTVLAVLAQAIMAVIGNWPETGLLLIANGLFIQIIAAYWLDMRDEANRKKAKSAKPIAAPTAGLSPLTA
jgi:hypothetical protein